MIIHPSQTVLFLIILFYGSFCFAQEDSQPFIIPLKIEQYEPAQGFLRIGPGPQDLIKRTDKGYTLLLPSQESLPWGIVISLGGWRWNVPDTIPADGSTDYEALSRNIATLRLTNGNPLDFYFQDSIMAEEVSAIQKILTQHKMEDVPVFFTGLSLAGTRVLKLAIFLRQNDREYWLKPRGLAIADAPLDMVRFWNAEIRAIRNDFHPNASGEGKWVTWLLKENLGGAPEANYDAYVKYSPFVYTASRGGNAPHLVDIPLRTYHEPDVNWWIENRRKDYYSMNSPDLAGLINELKLQGSTTAELITTRQTREGLEEGSSPHTWSIVDNAELMEWFLRQNAP